MLEDCPAWKSEDQVLIGQIRIGGKLPPLVLLAAMLARGKGWATTVSFPGTLWSRRSPQSGIGKEPTLVERVSEKDLAEAVNSVITAYVAVHGFSCFWRSSRLLR